MTQLYLQIFNKKQLAFMFFSFFLVGNCMAEEGYMEQKELLALLEKSQAPIIVDVRSSFEYDASHVPGAIHIPFWTAFTTDKMDGYEKNKVVVLYCEHGPRAGVAKLALSLAGFEDIRYLTGHMSSWKSAGLPVEP